MRIYNATNSQISLPFPGGRLDIPAHSVSGNVGANTDVISLLVSAYSADEIAFVVSGPYELNLCSSVPTVPVYTVQSLEEAIARFNKGAEKEEVKKTSVSYIPEEPVVEEPEATEEECVFECDCEEDEREEDGKEEEDSEELPTEPEVDYPAKEEVKEKESEAKPTKTYTNFNKKKHNRK